MLREHGAGADVRGRNKYEDIGETTRSEGAVVARMLGAERKQVSGQRSRDVTEAAEGLGTS